MPETKEIYKQYWLEFWLPLLKFIVAITTFCLCCTFCSCSAERQLANLLIRHPELRKDSTIVRTHEIVLPDQSSTIYITPEQLATMQHEASAAPSEMSKENIGKRTVVSANASAAVAADGRGGLLLTARQMADTLHITDTISVPVYLTSVRTQTVIKHEMNSGQRFFFCLGIFALVLLVLVIVWKIVKRIYLKK